MPGSPVMTSFTDLPALLRASRGFDAVVAALKKGQAGTIDGAWGSSAALASAALTQVAPGPTLVVLAHPTDLDTWSDDLETFLGVRPIQVPDRDEPGPRLKVLKSLLSPLSPMERGVGSEEAILPSPGTPGEGSRVRAVPTLPVLRGSKPASGSTSSASASPSPLTP